jgi:hypothetical protein
MANEVSAGSRPTLFVLAQSRSQRLSGHSFTR